MGERSSKVSLSLALPSPPQFWRFPSQSLFFPVQSGCRRLGGRWSALRRIREESPGFIEQRCLLTAGRGDPTESATEITQP